MCVTQSGKRRWDYIIKARDMIGSEQDSSGVAQNPEEEFGPAGLSVRGENSLEFGA